MTALPTKIVRNISSALLVLCVLLLPAYSHAAIDAGIASSDISVDLTPDNPGPYTDVVINLSSYATDLNKASISWKNGNNILLAGYGKTSYSFKTLGPDVSITFIVSITPVDSSTTINKTITISPKELNMLWESVDGYTPPFYRGKSFPASEGLIKVVAIPNSPSLGTAGRVTYTWKANDTTDLSLSGYNKDSYVFKNDNLDTSDDISVQASSIDGSYNATNSVTIPIVNPQLIFYKKSPTEGVNYAQALVGEASITEDQATIIGVPYFMSIKGNEGNLTYSWQTNGSDIPTPSKKNELTIEPTSRGGYATISLAIENVNLLFQKVSSQLKLDL